MKNEGPNAFDILDRYFMLMDDAPVGKGSVFPDDQAKERHESILMYAFRKYRAASYHFENVRHLLATESSNTVSMDLLNNDSLPNTAKAKISVRREADHFIYELAAFFEAAKSSLDFLASACCGYSSGIKTNSIQTFIRLVDQKAKDGPIFNAIKRYLLWPKQVREYRHHLVHQMVLTTSSGREVHRRGKLVKQIQHPVVVPDSTPSYYPDTRRSRMMEDEPGSLDYTWFEGTVKYPDGVEETIDFSVKYMPSKGYTEISEFMTLHLNSLENFFYDIIAEMKSLNFKKL